MKQWVKEGLKTLLQGGILAIVVGVIIGIASFFMTFKLTSVLLGAGFIFMCIGFLSMGGSIFGRTDMTYFHARSSGHVKSYENAQDDIKRFDESSEFAIVMNIAGILLILVSLYLN